MNCVPLVMKFIYLKVRTSFFYKNIQFFAKKKKNVGNVLLLFILRKLLCVISNRNFTETDEILATEKVRGCGHCNFQDSGDSKLQVCYRMVCMHGNDVRISMLSDIAEQMKNKNNSRARIQ